MLTLRKKTTTHEEVLVVKQVLLFSSCLAFVVEGGCSGFKKESRKTENRKVKAPIDLGATQNV
jgi:hypothetical protein